MEINSKAFAIPILTAITVNYKLDAVRIGIANALEFISILKQPLSCILNLFLYHLIPNLFAYFFHFRSLFPFLKLQIFKIISSVYS